MEKRVILAFVLSIAVMYAFTAIYSPRHAPEPVSGVQTATPPPPANQTPAVPSTPVEKTETPAPVPVEEAQADKAEDVVVDTPLYTATISNVGGVLKSYRLKAYPDGEGHPLELIDQASAAKVGWPLTLTTGDKALDDELSGAQLVAHKEADRLSL